MSNQRLGNPMDYVPSVQPESGNSPGNDPQTQKHDPKKNQQKERDTQTETTQSASQSNLREILRREGDSGLGIPQADYKTTRVLSEKETKKHHKELEKEMRQQAEEMLLTLEAESGWQLPKSLRQLLSGIFITVASVLGVMITTESIQFAVTVQSLPEWAQWLAIAGFALFGGILAVMSGWLLWKGFRLQRSPRINLKALKILSERQNMQKAAVAKQSEAKDLLEKYLQDYAITPEMHTKLLSMGMTNPQWSELKAGHARLFDANRPMSPKSWCEDFQRCFQSNLDKIARQRTLQYARRVGLGTAASPIAIVDRMIVLYSSFALIKDLLTIYNLRPTAGQSLITLAKAITHTYLAGVVGDAAEAAVDNLADGLNEFAESGLDVVTGTVGRAVSAKTAEATLNGFFLYRLGKKTTQLIQPTRTR